MRQARLERSMNVLQSAILAFSSFSKIPMPQVEWREDNMRYLMCFFPAVGLAIGIALALWALLSGALGFGSVLYGAGLALIPVAVSGGIHLDGFCDVVDAQSSHASPERKREILKDPHSGAFAAIAVAAYLVSYTALASDIPMSARLVSVLACMHVASRCLSGIATVAFKLSSSTGMLSMFHESAESRRVLVVLFVEFVASVVVMAVAYLPAIIMPCVGLLCLAALHPFAKRQFGGMSGDLAGFFLQVVELAMVCALVIALKVVAL